MEDVLLALEMGVEAGRRDLGGFDDVPHVRLIEVLLLQNEGEPAIDFEDRFGGALIHIRYFTTIWGMWMQSGKCVLN